MVDLPDRMPVGIERLPRNKVGYPVPWFVWWTPEGEPDFRIVKPDAMRRALQEHLCWICGDLLLGTQAFVIGPMCAINHTSAEPPSHLLCARWSSIACPFLANPKMVRRENYDYAHSYMPGVSIPRNPGVALVWPTRYKHWGTFNDGRGGMLFDIGEPVRSPEWYAQGREATRAEVEHSIDTGLPQLLEIAQAEGPDAIAELNRRRDATRALLPA